MSYEFENVKLICHWIEYSFMNPTLSTLPPKDAYCLKFAWLQNGVAEKSAEGELKLYFFRLSTTQ